MQTLAAWFGLKEGHKDFFIANDADARLLFARQALDSQLQTILRKSFRSDKPPKFVLYGEWGVGKTHTLHHVAYEIENTEGYSAKTVFVELPDINAKNTFQVAQGAILDALGLSTVRAWMMQYQTRHQSEALPLIQAATQSEDIAKAFLNLPTYGDIARISWDWLRGASLAGTEARNAGLPSSLEQSNQFAAVLRMLGRLCREIDGAILVIMIDEADKLRAVTNGDAIYHWLNSLKILSDDLTKEIGLIIAASFPDMDQMPDMLRDRQITSRFGEENYIHLPHFGPDETRDFVAALLGEWIDEAKRSALMTEFSAEADGESFITECFPFTEEAFSRFVDYAVRNGNFATPREIQKTLDDVMNRAIDDNRHVVSSSYFNRVLAGI